MPGSIGSHAETQKTLDGPSLDFSAPEVRAAESGLRISAARLKETMLAFGDAWESAAGYARISAALDCELPKLYRAYDAYVSVLLATGAERVTCSKSCSHCCSHYVTSVEPYELLFLHGRVSREEEYPSRLIAMHRRTTLFRSLRRDGDGDEAEDRALYRYYLRNQPCPFLAGDGSCGVYAARPMSCRMYHSVSHPSLCKGKSVIAPNNRNFLIELPEDIEADIARAGRIFAESRIPESLFEGLLKMNEMFGAYDSGGLPAD